MRNGQSLIQLQGIRAINDNRFAKTDAPSVINSMQILNWRTENRHCLNMLNEPDRNNHIWNARQTCETSCNSISLGIVDVFINLSER